MSGLESAFGISFPDFAILCTDQSKLQSIIVQKTNEDKITELAPRILLAAVGESGDCKNFSELIARNYSLYSLRNSLDLSTAAIASFIRNELATALRQGPYATNLLLAGVEEEGDETVSSLYYIDYLATMHKTKFAAHGYCSNFILSTLDQGYRENMTEDEALGLVDQCINQIQTRLIAGAPNFLVKIITKDEVRTVVKASAEPIL